MTVTILQDIEVSHHWVDEDGQLYAVVLAFKEGDVLDSDAMQIGDAGRALARLVRLGLAAE